MWHLFHIVNTRWLPATDGVTYLVRCFVAERPKVATILDMKSASSTVLTNLARIPSDLHPSILALLGDSATLASVRELVGAAAPTSKSVVPGTASVEVAPPTPLALVVKPDAAASEPKRIYVTAPKYMQESERATVDAAIAAIKKLWPAAEIIDANTHWPAGERRGPAWEAGFSDLIKTVDAIVIVTNNEGWIGGGIEMELKIAKGAGRHVIATRSTGDGTFVFYQEVVTDKFRGTGSKSKIPPKFRQSVVGYIVFDNKSLLTATHVELPK